MEVLPNYELLHLLFTRYNLSDNEKEELLNIIKCIFIHDEFQRRCTQEFAHHDRITLGQHIIEVTIMTYILSKKYSKKKRIDLNIALKIAMLHDLYAQPWQNNPQADVNSFFNKHGFRHPIEAVINGSVWFPDIFNKEKEAKIIIDGIVHHMFPLPVVRFRESKHNVAELKNFEYVNLMAPMVKEHLINSSNRIVMGNISISPSIYNEGKIVSFADKIVSLSNLKGCNFHSMISLVTGQNKNLEDIKMKKITKL